MSELRVHVTRSGLPESVHRVSVAVVNPGGRLVASSGDPSLCTYWRSAAKPFQAMPVVEDGAADAFGLGDEELALACASHSSEPVHREVVDRFLSRIGCVEADLACGPHTPLGAAAAEEVVRTGMTMTQRWSNCSGKHTGMLALARHHGWPLAGYTDPDHPVQRRLLASVATWTGRTEDQIRLGVDGCTTVCFHLDLAGMATAWARFGTSEEPAAVRLRAAILGHPHLIAGTGRFCTDLMVATSGAVLAKVGADGIYSATVPALGVGITLKVEDGDTRCAPAALFAVLSQVGERLGGFDPSTLQAALEAHVASEVRTTRNVVVGRLEPVGVLHFEGR